MDAPASTEKEEINSDEIHAIEIETTKKSVVVTSEKSHIERTQETIENFDGKMATNDGAQVSNGICDTSIMRINEDSSSQIIQDEGSRLEERPIEVGNSDSVENCHELGDGHRDVSDEAKADSESVARVESNTFTQSNVDNHSATVAIEETSKISEQVTNTTESILSDPLKDDPIESVVEEHYSKEKDIERDKASQDTLVQDTSNEPLSNSEQKPVEPHQEIESQQKNKIDSIPAEEMSENFPEFPKTSDSVESEDVRPISKEQHQESEANIGSLSEGCPSVTETNEPPLIEEGPSMKPVDVSPPVVNTAVNDAPTQVDQNYSGSAEIKEENLKIQLQEIIKEIDREVDRNEEEEHETAGGSPRHTWKPRKSYEKKKVEIQYEEVVPITLPDVAITERKEEKAKEAKNTPKEKPRPPTPPPKPKMHQVNGEPLTPLGIPDGLPLLAKIASKEGADEANREKIPLERLFTPATDSEDLTPKKRKSFASSAFYKPDHPTIEDQVDLAHKISVSLIDEENKASKGHSMYMKRKNRSSKWIHAAYEEDEETGDFLDEEDLLPPKESKQRPALKLLMNPKGLHDYTSIQQNYEELSSMSSQTTHAMNSIEGYKEIISDMQSPTGKGAALFAKRKKRMDKFIVDENSVQKCSINSKTTTQENSFLSSHQEEVQAITNSLSMLPPSIESASAGSLILPDITKILTTPKPLDKKNTKTRSGPKGKSSLKREYSWNISSSKKETTTATKNHSFHNAFPSKFEPDIDLRPGTPPMFVISDQQGNLMDKSAHFANTSDVNEVQDQSNSEGGAIYTAEVKVVQSPSVPATPIIEGPTAQEIHLDRLSSDSMEDKRKSFNLAAKGWGTYNDFYTPRHLGTS